MTVTLLHGDCREVRATMPAESVDSVVTDPPYHLTSMVQRLSRTNTGDVDKNFTKKAPGQGRNPHEAMARGFMGKQWDGGDIAFRPELWADVLRVLKPGAHLAAFGGTRTFHRMMCAIEDAGFEIRDTLMWVYGSGFPKSHNLPGGLGTALKPAWEPIVLARKPLVGTVAANVAAHGTGALNIDGCRVPGAPEATRFDPAKHSHDGWRMDATGAECAERASPLGRWPANLAHDGSDEVLEAFAAFGERASSAGAVKRQSACDTGGNKGAAYGAESRPSGTPMIGYGDTGTAARFFFSAKASKAERGEGNTHPTVKPLALMQWLCRLVTPPGGTVLDPFSGSGSTLIAAAREGFDCIGIEREAEYIEIARRQIAGDAPLFSEVA